MLERSEMTELDFSRAIIKRAVILRLASVKIRFDPEMAQFRIKRYLAIVEVDFSAIQHEPSDRKVKNIHWLVLFFRNGGMRQITLAARIDNEVNDRVVN